jgi:integrase
MDGQKLLNTIAATSSLSHQTLRNVKSVLSAVFSFAKRMGAFDGVNPMEDTEAPTGRPTVETHASSNIEVNKMLEVLKGTSRSAVAVAAYTGLSLGELRGLKWEDITEDSLNVRRLVWRKQIVLPKTVARQDSLPMLPVVKEALAEQRKNNPQTTWVFEGPNFFPMDLATLGSKRIKEGLAGSGVEWKGWHALRRGFAIRLHEAGVQDRIIQSLMRHSSLSVTMKHYVKANSAANTNAIRRLMTPEPNQSHSSNTVIYNSSIHPCLLLLMLMNPPKSC